MADFTLSTTWTEIAAAAADAVTLRHKGGDAVEIALAASAPSGDGGEVITLTDLMSVAVSGLTASSVNAYARARPGGGTGAASLATEAAKSAAGPLVFGAAREGVLTVARPLGAPAAQSLTVGDAMTPLDLGALVSGTPARWRAPKSTLPPGLSLSSAGVVSGAPANVGPANRTTRVVAEYATGEAVAFDVAFSVAGITGGASGGNPGGGGASYAAAAARVANDHVGTWHWMESHAILPSGDVLVSGTAMGWSNAVAADMLEHWLLLVDGDTGEIKKQRRLGTYTMPGSYAGYGDEHNAGALFVAPDGLVHAFSTAHGTANLIRHWSSATGDPDTFTEQTDITLSDGDSLLTYVQVRSKPGTDDCYLWVRDTNSSRWVQFSSSDAGATWSEDATVLVSVTERQYMHAQNIYNDGGTWYLKAVAVDHPQSGTAKGKLFALKINIENPVSQTMDSDLPVLYDVGANKSLRLLDETPGMDCILFCTFDLPVPQGKGDIDHTSYQYRLLRLTGSDWEDPTDWTFEDLEDGPADAAMRFGAYVNGGHIVSEDADATELTLAFTRAVDSYTVEKWSRANAATAWTKTTLMTSADKLVRPWVVDAGRRLCFVQEMVNYNHFVDSIPRVLVFDPDEGVADFSSVPFRSDPPAFVEVARYGDNVQEGGGSTSEPDTNDATEVVGALTGLAAGTPYLIAVGFQHPTLASAGTDTATVTVDGESTTQLAHTHVESGFTAGQAFSITLYAGIVPVGGFATGAVRMVTTANVSYQALAVIDHAGYSTTVSDSALIANTDQTRGEFTLDTDDGDRIVTVGLAVRAAVGNLSGIPSPRRTIGGAKTGLYTTRCFPDAVLPIGSSSALFVNSSDPQQARTGGTHQIVGTMDGAQDNVTYELKNLAAITAAFAAA
jgi:hypothetical protein